MAGLSSTGFDRKLLVETIADLKQSIRDEFGSTANVSDDSVFGQLVSGIFAERIDELWLALEAVYNSWSIDTAEGTQLDALTTLVGITRNRATRSGVDLVVTADNNTTISGAGSFLVETVVGKERFRNVTGAVINGTTGAIGGYISVNTVLNSTLYTVTLDGITFSYTSFPVFPGATETEILDGLAAAIDANVNFTASRVGNQLRWDAVDKTLNVSVATSAELTINKLDALVEMESVELGPIVATIGDLTNIITSLVGVDSVTNLDSARLGTDEETDTQLRLRTIDSLQRGGRGTPDTIRAAILDIDGVNACTVIENITDSVDVDGRPPHSFEVVVSFNGLAETEADILQAIWDNKPLGIRTYGATSGSATDSQGTPQTVYYSSPAGKDVYARIEYTLYDEEIFPVGGEAAIKDAFVEYGTSVAALDKDLIPQRFFGTIYTNVKGIDTLTVYLAVVDEGDPAPSFPGDYTVSRVELGSNEIALFNIAFVNVVAV